MLMFGGLVQLISICFLHEITYIFTPYYSVASLILFYNLMSLWLFWTYIPENLYILSSNYFHQKCQWTFHFDNKQQKYYQSNSRVAIDWCNFFISAKKKVNTKLLDLERYLLNLKSSINISNVNLFTFCFWNILQLYFQYLWHLFFSTDIDF